MEDQATPVVETPVPEAQTPEQLAWEAATRRRLSVEIESRLRSELNAENAKKFSEVREQLVAQNQEALQKELEEFKKSLEPPTKEQIADLLNQEYITFTVALLVADGEQAVERKFTLRELPMAKEKQFFDRVKAEIVPRARQLGEMSFEILDGDVAQKIKSAIETFEPTFDLLCEACAIALNPNKKGNVDMEWVKENISTYRIWTILRAQLEIQRLRDFFSQLSQGSRGTTMMTRAATRK